MVFKLSNTLKLPTLFASCNYIKFLVKDAFPSLGMPDPPETVLTDEDQDRELNLDMEETVTLLQTHPSPRTSYFERLEYGNGPKEKPSIEEPPE